MTTRKFRIKIKWDNRAQVSVCVSLDLCKFQLTFQRAGAWSFLNPECPAQCLTHCTHSVLVKLNKLSSSHLKAKEDFRHKKEEQGQGSRAFQEEVVISTELGMRPGPGPKGKANVISWVRAHFILFLKESLSLDKLKQKQKFLKVPLLF